MPGGQKLEVTDANKLQYLDMLANHRLAGSVHDEVNSFLKGLWEIVPDNLLSMFDEYELEVGSLFAQCTLFLVFTHVTYI